MNLNNFTNKAQEAILASQSLAQEYSNNEMSLRTCYCADASERWHCPPQVIAKIGTRPAVLIAEL